MALALKRPGRCVPTLYSVDIDPPVFDTACTLVLLALGDECWHGDCEMTSEEQDELLQRIEGSCRSDGGRRIDDRLTRDEIQNFVQIEANRTYLRELPSSVHGMLNWQLVDECFDFFHGDGSESLDCKEWLAFLDTLALLRMQYFLRSALLQARAFFGRGQPWWHLQYPDILCQAAGKSFEVQFGSISADCESAPMVSSTKLSPHARHLWQFGRDEDSRFLCPPGWWWDLCYYSANNHPLHSICACDPSHPLLNCERFAMEVGTFGFSVIMVHLNKKIIKQHAPMLELDNPIFCNLIIVTLPGILMWNLLYQLFACPVASVQINDSQNSEADQKKVGRIKHVGTVIGYMIVVIGALANVWMFISIIFCIDPTNLHSFAVVSGRLQGWLFSWLYMVLVIFNPLIAWGQPDPIGHSCLGDSIGLGQWRIEKQKFQNLCIRAMKYWLESRPMSARKRPDQNKLCSFQWKCGRLGINISDL